MHLYRISRAEYINDLSGTGAKIYGGRWNRVGMAALYTSQSRALAMLELLVHFNARAAIRNLYRFAVLEIDEKMVTELPSGLLPRDLYSFNNENLWNLTDTYFKENGCLAIRVPSVIIQKEHNVILNPEHPDFADVRIRDIEDAVIDPRLAR